VHFEIGALLQHCFGTLPRIDLQQYIQLLTNYRTLEGSKSCSKNCEHIFREFEVITLMIRGVIFIARKMILAPLLIVSVVVAQTCNEALSRMTAKMAFPLDYEPGYHVPGSHVCTCAKQPC
jgi:hypothetical protein